MAKQANDSEQYSTTNIGTVCAALVFGAALLAACGGSVDDSSANGSSSSSATSVGTNSSVFVGATNTGGVASNLSTSSMGAGTGGVGGGLFVGTGGSVNNAGDAGSNNGTGCTNLTGGQTIATADILARIENNACAGTSSELEVNPALLEFVVDVSGSMNDTVYNGSNGQSKWAVTQAALANAILNGLPDYTGVGILFFPNMSTVPNTNTTPQDVTNCVNTIAAIPVAPLGAASANTAQRALIAQGLSNALPAGGTPTEDAYDYAYNSGVIPALQMYGFYTPFIVLITDGQPTIAAGCEGTGAECSPAPTAPIIADITAAFNGTPTVKTFIIGSPGSDAQSCTGQDARPWLSAAATAGGTPLTTGCQNSGPNYCHFDMTQSVNFAQDLADALNVIMKEAIPCSVQIPAPTNGQPPDPNNINVIYDENVVNGTPTAQWLIYQTCDVTCGGGTDDGWYIDPSTAELVLCPNTCRTIQSDKYAVLNVLQGCKSSITDN